MRLLRLPTVALVALLLALVTAPASAVTDPARSKQWGLELVRAPSAWSVGRGAGTTIAIVDTGVDLAHEDLAAKVLPGRSFVGQSVQDGNGHGTHVAGIAAAITDNGRGVAGVAPEAKILPVRVLDENGVGSASAVADGIRWAADQRATVINLSLGDVVPPVFSDSSSSTVDAIEYAWQRGSVVVISGGNHYLPTSAYGRVHALVVGAVDRQDRKASYSGGIGAALWAISAPGGASGAAAQEEDILSTYWFADAQNSYAYVAGTSQAAPFVAGAAAILRGLGLSPQQTVDRLLATAKDLGPRGKDNDFGVGRLDVGAAVAGLGPAPGVTPAEAAPPRRPAGSSATTRPRSSGSPTSSSAAGATETAPLGTFESSAESTTTSAPAPAEDDGDVIGSGDVAAGERASRGEDSRAVPLWLITLAVLLLAASGYGGFRRLRHAP